MYSFFSQEKIYFQIKSRKRRMYDDLDKIDFKKLKPISANKAMKISKPIRVNPDLQNR
jgi:hypothetical protein